MTLAWSICGRFGGPLVSCVLVVAGLLKRWLDGTMHGAVREQYLDYYLDEYTFRFNRRNSTHRGKLFHRLAEQAVAIEPVPVAELVRRAWEKHTTQRLP